LVLLFLLGKFKNSTDVDFFNPISLVHHDYLPFSLSETVEEPFFRFVPAGPEESCPGRPRPARICGKSGSMRAGAVDSEQIGMSAVFFSVFFGKVRKNHLIWAEEYVILLYKLYAFNCNSNIRRQIT